MSNTNPLNNQSYINKDFQTIYPELLDLVKKLTYKWDPTVSNESDPGVLLIKLNAIIADKNNYNIDKNALECFPDSVTQQGNAYKLFAQLGYNMHWYKSGIGKITMKWDSEKVTTDRGETLSYTIPQFTMVSDGDKETVYTLLNSATIPTDGTNVEVDVIQGIVKDYSIGSMTLLNMSFLDNRNRLYFSVPNVAENGIFISDAIKTSNGEYSFVWENTDEFGWKKVDNLYIQPAGTKCYKFGLDQTTNTCYIEFPSDISDLIGEGIFVKYIQTNGKLGNVAANRLTAFCSNIEDDTYKSIYKIPKRTISNDIKLWNVSSIANGDDPETIDDAYVGYQKHVGTFDTLVTLRDYLNYIVSEDFMLVSNGVIADRTNDIQSSYKVVTNEDGNTKIETVVASQTETRRYLSNDADIENINSDSVVEETVEVPEMSAYDLKTYLLEYSDISKFSSNTSYNDQKRTMEKDYNKSFNLKLDDNDTPLATSVILQTYFNEAKSISHDFIDKLPNRPLFYKNKFKLDLTIIPNMVVTQSQADEIERNVYEALYRNLISRNISFGKELTYEKIYDICNNADNRIKAVALENINYITYAVVYIDSDEYHFTWTDIDGITNRSTQIGLNEIPVSQVVSEDSSESSWDWGQEIALDVLSKNVLAGVTPMYKEEESFKFDITQTDGDIIKDVCKADTYTEIAFNDISEKTNGGQNYTEPAKIGKNESLIFYQPSLIEDETYANSVKYIYYTTIKYNGSYVDYLPANEDIILEDGQYLFCLWKDEDSKDAPYSYAKYGQGTILSSTTRLKSTEYDKDHTIRNRLESAGYEGFGQILGDLNDDLYEISDTILTSNKVITIKKINSAKLNDSTNDCYWITNDIDESNGESHYRMKFEFTGNLDTDIVESSYHNEQVYISTFSSSEIEGFKPFEKYELGDDQTIYVLEPETTVETYTDYNADSMSAFENYATVTGYKLVDKISGEKGDSIVCTGNIYKDAGEREYYVPTTDTSPSDSKTYFFVSDSTKTREQFSGYVKTEDQIRDSSKTYYVMSGGKYEVAKFTDDNAGFTYGVNYYERKFDPDVIYYEKEPFNLLGKLGELKIGASIKWGHMETKIAPSGSKDVSFQVLVYNPIAEYIGLSTNTILKGGYKLEKHSNKDISLGESSSTGTSTFTYRLKTNEYFMYTNDSRDELHILEDGTTINIEVPNNDSTFVKVIKDDANNIIDVEPIELIVRSSIDIDNASNEGIKAFTNDMWYRFTASGVKDDNGKIIDLERGMIPEIVENQIIKLGEGTSVKVKQNSFIYSVPDKDGKWTTETVCDTRYDNLKITSEGVFRAPKGATLTDDSAWIKDPYALLQYSIQYKNDEETSYTEMQQSEHTGLSWNGYTILNLNSGPSAPQKLNDKNNQKIIFYSRAKDATNYTSHKISDGYIQTNQTILLSGGKGINVTAEDADGNVYTIEVFNYQESNLAATYPTYTPTDDIAPQEGKNYFVYNGSSDTYYLFEGDTFETGVTYYEGAAESTDVGDVSVINYHKISLADTNLLVEMGNEIPLDLPMSIMSTINKNESSVILPIKICDKVSGVREFNISLYENDSTSSGAPLPPLGYTVNANDLNRDMWLAGDTLNAGVYYFKLDATTEDTLRIQVDCDSYPFSFEMLPLFTYRYNEELSNVDMTILENRVSRLDVKKKFDYTYQPPYDVEIENPLDSKKFFDRHHICNQFTIPQISSIKIKTLNKRG